MVLEDGSPLGLAGLCVRHAFMLVVHVSVILECFLHMHGVGHGHSDITIRIRMLLCEVFFHGCMIGYMLFMFTYYKYIVIWLLLSRMRSWNVYLIWSCINEHTLAIMADVWLHAYALYFICCHDYIVHISC